MKINKRPDNGKPILAPTSETDRHALAYLFTELAHHNRAISRDDLNNVSVGSFGYITGTTGTATNGRRVWKWGPTTPGRSISFGPSLTTMPSRRPPPAPRDLDGSPQRRRSARRLANT